MPNGTNTTTKGHAKGVVAFEGRSGFWMVHSVPKFPPPPGEVFNFSDTGMPLGQSFLCLTLPVSKLETVAKQLYFTEPFLYATRLPSSLKSSYAMMAKVIAGQRSLVEPWHSIQTLPNSRYVTQVLSFAKTREFGEDLYQRLIFHNFRSFRTSSMMVQTSTKTGRLPSVCTSRFAVYNTKIISIRAESASGQVRFEFNSNSDNSKWAKSGDPGYPWVCIGDMDRVSSQKRRGGGAVCLSSARLNYMYELLLSPGSATFEPCYNTIKGLDYDY